MKKPPVFDTVDRLQNLAELEEDLERLATQIGPLLVVRIALGLETLRDVGWKGRTESINDNG